MDRLCDRWPSISLVTPNYNQVDYLEDTLRSVVSQKYPNLEYIVIDGGSDDGSRDVIARYDDALDYWHSKPDQGMYDAISQGFRQSSGEIMGWVNSDDLHFPWTLHVVASIFSNFPSVNWITSMQLAICDCQGIVRVRNAKGYSKEAFVQGRYGGYPDSLPGFGNIHQDSTFWRRSLWESSDGLNLSYEGASDFDLWCQFYKRECLYGANTPLGNFRRHPDQKTLSTTYSNGEECKKIFKRHYSRPPLSIQRLATRWRLHRSILQTRLAPMIGYEGKVIKRNFKESTWEIERNHFL